VVVTRTESVPGFALPRLRAYPLIDAAPPKVFAVINRCGAYTEFMPRTVKSVELRRNGATVTCEVHIQLPFFLGRLKSVTRGVHSIGPPAWGRAWQMLRGNFKRNVGRWRFSAWRGNPAVTLVEYTVHAVPDLFVPNALIGKANLRSIPNMIRALRKRLTGRTERHKNTRRQTTP
jgi:ribosome-associated toxin RatA of RatAB toxin-antitoxin module